MKKIGFIIFLYLILVVSGCQDNPKSNILQTDPSDTNFSKLSTAEEINQVESNEAKESLKNNKDLSTIHAVNSDEQMLITFEINHLKRFQLEKIRKDIEKQIKRQFSHLDIYVSTDQKIISELEKLEESIQKNKAKQTQINKKVKELIALAKKET